MRPERSSFGRTQARPQQSVAKWFLLRRHTWAASSILIAAIEGGLRRRTSRRFDTADPMLLGRPTVQNDRNGRTEGKIQVKVRRYKNRCAARVIIRSLCCAQRGSPACAQNAGTQTLCKATRICGFWPLREKGTRAEDVRSLKPGETLWLQQGAL
jgi:hypothetical protein